MLKAVLTVVVALLLTMSPAQPRGFMSGIISVGGTGSGGGGGGGCSQATTALAALSGLSTAQQNAYTTMICGMVTDGTWALLDTFYYLATNTQANAIVNLVNPGTYNGVVNGTCTFTALSGIKGDGSTCYVNTGFSQGVSSPHMSLNSATMGLCDLNIGEVSAPADVQIGAFDASNYATMQLTNSGWKVNINGLNAAFATQTISTTQGSFIQTRIDAATVHTYLNAGEILPAISAASGSTPTPGINFWFIGGSTSNALYGPSDDMIGYVFLGGGMTSTQVTNMYNRLATMNSAMGVPTGCGGGLATNLQTPGPSPTLYANNPYYTCSTTIYVSPAGSGTGSGSSTANAMSFANARTNAAAAGTCFQMAAGTYQGNLAGDFPIHGGTGPTKTGYVVWRCAIMPFSFSSNVLQGEGTGCVFNGSAGGNVVVYVAASTSYVMFDGIEVDCSVNTQGVGFGVDNGSANATSHHIWVMNSDFHNCTQSGIQTNNTDWLFFIHNVWHDNAASTGSCGSGLSIFEPAGLASYTPTSGNPDYWHSATTGRTYDMVLTYNYGVRNYNNQSQACAGGLPTDGEGIILDVTTTTCNSGAVCPFAGNYLVMGNVMFGNSGHGIESFYQYTGGTASAHADIINNTTYSNSYLNATSGPADTGDLVANNTPNGTYWNNIAITTTGTQACGNGSGGTYPSSQACTTLDSAPVNTNTWTNNLTSPTGLISMNTGTSYPLTGTNKNIDTATPGLTSLNPITSSTGTGVSNFALTGTSPAVGAGRAFDLWQQSGTIDIGACPYNSPGPVASCP